MKKIVFLIFSLSCTSLFGFAQEKATIRDFQDQRITGVEAGGVFKVVITQGEKTGVTLTVPAELKHNFILSMDEQGVVKIKTRADFKLKKNVELLARICCSSLERIELGGACQLTGEGSFTAQRLSVELSGSSKVKIDGYCNIAEKAEFELSGASSLSGRMNAREIDTDISGASNITLTGEAKTGKMDVSGAANINCTDFLIEHLSAEISGAASVVCHVTGRLDIEASGAAKFSYKGSPEVSKEISGAASVKQAGGGNKVLPD